MNSFINPQFGTITNFEPVGISRYNSLQVSLKNFAVQFRTESFNIFNYSNFGPPAVGDFVQGTHGGATIRPAAGHITTTTTTSRRIQFVLKILF